jgi:hypothetical protein
VTVQTARDCVWTARVEAAWASVLPAEGQGETQLVVTAQANEAGVPRSTALVVNDQRTPVMQEPAPCLYRVSSSEESITYRGGRVTVQLAATEACPWTPQSDEAWARAVTTAGIGSGPVEIAVDSNAGQERSAHVLIGGESLVVVQDAAPGSGGCGYSIHPGALTFTREGGIGEFGLAAPPGCAWAPWSPEPWIHVTSNVNNTGTARVRYHIDPNPAAASRTGSVRIASRRHTVVQRGSAQP